MSTNYVYEITVSEDDIINEQDTSTFNTGVTVARIKTIDSSGRFCYFNVETRISRHHKPVIRVTEINSGSRKSKDIIGTWKGESK